MSDGSRAPLLEKEAYPSAEDNMSRDCQRIVTLLAGRVLPGQCQDFAGRLRLLEGPIRLWPLMSTRVGVIPKSAVELVTDAPRQSGSLDGHPEA